jgi:hypothetical protein
MNDIEREEIARLWYDLDKLDEIFEDCTKDEFITRLFKNHINEYIISFKGNSVILGGDLYWSTLKQLFELCLKLKKEMHINAGKGPDGYPHLWTTIQDLSE